MDDFTAACNAEEWRPVVGREGWYEVSNLGGVKRVKAGRGTWPGRVLKPYVGQNGYPFVNLGGSGQTNCRPHYIHTLVASAFLGIRPAGFDINHLNGQKRDSHRSNLEYVSRAENARHAVRMGLSARGSASTSALLDEEAVVKIKALLGTTTQKEIGKMFGVARSTINNIAIGKNWTHVA